MAVTIIAGGNKLEGTISVYSLDATLTFTPRLSSTITKHPVETGSTITDHVFLNNTIIDVTGIITNSGAIPVKGGTASGVGLGDLIPSPTVSGTGGIRVQSAHDILVNIFNNRELITINSELQVYDNCIVTSLSLPRSPDIGDTLRIEMTLEQLQVVSSERLPVSSDLLDAIAINQKKGTKTASDSDNEVGSKEARIVRTIKTYIETQLQVN
jgi:hypothetical protein